MEQMGREVVYIIGPCNGRRDRIALEAAEELLRRKGYAVLTPRSIPADAFVGAKLPICLSMIEAADMVWAMAGADEDPRCKIERLYAVYQGVEVLEDAELGTETDD